MTQQFIKNGKQPLYVQIYEILYKKIKDGKFDSGEKLPGEKQLAEELSVSRGTLRQALLLLQEDGLIINKHGSGNFVTKKLNLFNSGLERSSIIGKKYSNHECDIILDSIKYQPSTEVVRKNLKLTDNNLVSIFEISFVINNVVIGFSDVFIPYENLVKDNVKLNDNNVLKKYVINYIENKVVRSRINIRIIEPRDRILQKLNIEKNEPIFCFYEIMYDGINNPITYSKTYCNPEYYEFNINSK
ncbi:GntR family transcriptional regulator [Helcococcus kunzii]|uniref:GntR family transcriptional regulator n=1 Tax=Helcococcus kunzii TaxID=40091 RepID=UPI00389D24B8